MAIASFIDNAVQAFYSQVVDQLSQKRGPPLQIDVSLLDLDVALGSCLKKPLLIERSVQPPSEVPKQNPEREQEEQKIDTRGAATQDENYRKKMCLRITDSGPGISPFKLRQALTQFGHKSLQVKRSSPFEFSEHGISLQVNCLRLGHTSLILSKTSP